MQYLTAILLAIGLGSLIWFLKIFRNQGVKKTVFIALFALKLIAAIGVHGIYTYYYDPEMSDIHKFYSGGQALYAAADDNFVDYLRLVTGIQGDQPQLQKYYDNANHWTRQFDYGLFNDNRTIMRFNAIVCLFSFGNIFIHIVIMAFLAFLGSFYLFRGFRELLKIKTIYLLIASFLIPSCLFWASGLLKEGLMMLAIGFAFYFLAKLYKNFCIWHLIGFGISCTLLFASKIYVLPAFLPAVAYLFIIRKMKPKFQLITFGLIMLVSAVLVMFSGPIFGYDILSTLSGKQNDFINYISLQDDPGSTYDLTRLSPDLWSFVKIIPEGLLNVFFRPFPSEINSAFMLFSFLEVLGFAVLMIIPIFFFKKPSAENLRFILFFTMFILFLYVVVGVYTPNTGSIVRYRIPALPFLFMILTMLTDWERIGVRFSVLRRNF